jgi:hypothetical protein
MDDLLPFASRGYLALLLLLAFSRGMDFLSTWVATPNLVLEGNPIAKKIGWRWGIPLNIAICIGVAFEPVMAIAISTTSILVAARNFQSAWLMRSMGEENYRDWHIARIQETRISTYLFCLAGNTLLSAAVGAALIYFCEQLLVPCAIGMGMIAYAVAVAFYSLLAVWRIRRSTMSKFRRAEIKKFAVLESPIAPAIELNETPDLKIKNN